VGVYQSHSIYENGAVTVLLADLQAVLHREGRLTGFSVVLDHSSAAQVPVETVCQQLTALADDAGESFGLSAMPTKEYASNSTHIRTAHAMAWLTSTIATIVGVIGMLNTMVMSVVERIAEISVLRALGWRKSRVVRMILEESVAVSLAGATLGALAAVLLTRWLATLPAVGGFVSGHIAPVVIAKGFLIALLVGLLGGLYPAYFATQLPPAQGIRHE
jgi:putative ABC transport system permease protein